VDDCDTIDTLMGDVYDKGSEWQIVRFQVLTVAAFWDIGQCSLRVD
jgi:hypothetical protein